jgi:hypothetical protein
MIFLTLYNERTTDRSSIFDKAKSFFPPICVETTSEAQPPSDRMDTGVVSQE